MGKEHAETRSKALPSHIPVISPRPAQSSLPSSLSTPQLGLVSPTRHLAVSGTPAPISGHNAPAPGAAGGLTSFRSFRNLLSFGPSKSHASTPLPASSGVMRPFAGFRHSSQVERSPRMSTVQPPPDEKAQDDLPVLSIEMAHTIELSHRVDEPLIDSEELQKQLGLRPQTPETISISPTSSSATSINTLDPPTTPSGLGMSELSTIMEAETSGLSQHFQFDDSRDDLKLSPLAHNRLLKNVASGPLLRAGEDEELRARRSREASPLDLSTSKVSSEVLAALSGPDTQGWLHSVVVDDRPQARVSEEEAENGDVTFNLDAVDPELAALLSPNSASRSPSRSPASAHRMILPPSPLKPALELDVKPRASTSAIPTSPPPHSQSVPVRRSSSAARPSIPRLARSASECPRPKISSSPPLSSPTRPVTAERSSPKAGSSRPSLQLRRPAPSSPTADSHLPRRPTLSGRDSKPRKSAISRLVTPSRHLTAGRSALRPDGSPSSPDFAADDLNSARTSSVTGSPSGRRGALQRPSLDDSASTRGPSRLSVRGRATSLDETTPHHPSLIRPNDWLGPRTARAFAAAGLLESERDGTVLSSSVSRPGSRFTSSRSERDIRSQYAPSRAGFSDGGSRASWGRRSGSISEVLSSQGAESASTPRTAFSAASTAPTSISAASSSQKYLQTELQLLQDRHALETGALLNALADSQRTTRLLRDENVQLRDQIQRLEDRLADTLDELRRMQLAPPPKLPRSTFYRLPGSYADSARRPLSRSRLQTVLHPGPEDRDRDCDREETSTPYNPIATYDDPMPIPMPSPKLTRAATLDSFSDAHKRRHSTSSSIFPILPSNMSMLLSDEGALGGSARSTRSVSPSSTIPGQQTLLSEDLYETHHRRTSSTGNISPTTANFSMMTGSPGSLHLRPEHERLLGDMPTLDLCAEGYETEVYDE